VYRTISRCRDVKRHDISISLLGYDMITICIQALRSRILAALLHATPAAGVSQTLRRGRRNGITELSQGAPPIFGWAAITLGIGPHSS